MSQNIEHRTRGDDTHAGSDRHQTWVRRARRVVASAFCGGVVLSPTSASAQIDDAAPSNAGLPGAALISQVMAWGKWVGLVVCVLAIVYGAATWRGMGGNTGRGVEGKMYVAAGAIGAMVIGLATIVVNTLYAAGNAGG